MLLYLCSYSVVILLISVETSPISRFYDQGDQQRPWLQPLLRFATSKGDAQYVSLVHTIIGVNNSVCAHTESGNN